MSVILYKPFHLIILFFIYVPQGPKDLQVSLFQALVLLLFNYNPNISFEEICAAINIEVSEDRKGLNCSCWSKQASFTSLLCPPLADGRAKAHAPVVSVW